MKSRKVMDASFIKPNQKPFYSDLRVLFLPSGFYIGTLYTDPLNGFVGPGSIDSIYFETKEQAESALESLIENGYSSDSDYFMLSD